VATKCYKPHLSWDSQPVFDLPNCCMFRSTWTFRADTRPPWRNENGPLWFPPETQVDQNDSGCLCYECYAIPMANIVTMTFETIGFRLVCWVFPQVWHTKFSLQQTWTTLASSRALTTGWRNRWLKTCSKLGPMNQALNSLINWD